MSNIDAIATIDSLEKLYIRDCPSFTKFPKFSTSSHLKTLHLDRLGETFSIENINSLKQLENLILINVFSLKEIPNDLSASLKQLKIKTEYIQKNTKKILELNNIDNLVFYPNLKDNQNFLLSQKCYCMGL